MMYRTMENDEMTAVFIALLCIDQVVQQASAFAVSCQRLPLGTRSLVPISAVLLDLADE